MTVFSEGAFAMLGMYWSDVSGLKKLDRALSRLDGKSIRKIGSRALNRAGGAGREKTRIALKGQTGLTPATIRRFLKVKRATYNRLEYRINGRGGDISLKYFDAEERRKGVRAKPFGQRRIFAGTFIKGGKFPNRVSIGLGGHVFARTGAGRSPIEKQKSGVILPREVLKGESARAWQATVAKVLPSRVIHEIKRETGKVFS
ncbi:MAG: hypothetical protein ABJL55_16400 [Roseibium sp.]